VDSESVLEKIAQKYNIAEGSVTGKNKSIISCTNDQAKNIGLEEGVTKIALIDDYSVDQELIFASGNNRRWNKKNFGPINIPSRGDKLKLNLTNIEIYFDLIKYHENNEIAVSDSQIFINNIKTDEYIIKNNYFFVLDDNRSDSKDSRYWGFLPETHIIGKSMFILYPVNNQGFISSLKRVFKKAN
jgi:signal peptidase I